METTSKQLAESVLRILSPLRGVWEDAGWLIDTIEKWLIQENHLQELAELLIRAAGTVDRDERIRTLSHASDMVRRNREKEIAERSREQQDCGNIICNLF